MSFRVDLPFLESETVRFSRSSSMVSTWLSPSLPRVIDALTEAFKLEFKAESFALDLLGEEDDEAHCIK